MACGFGFNVEQDYFHWLCEQVHIDQEERSYWLLAKDLHKAEFYALVPRDENRVYDGLELREDYLSSIGYPDYVQLMGECSVLEMMIAVARRIDFQTSDPYGDDGYDQTAYWFWQMIENLGLTDFSDDVYMQMNGIDIVDNAIRQLVERQYEADGNGGLFPLRNASEDQRDVEIWYQMCSYLNEKQVI